MNRLLLIILVLLCLTAPAISAETKFFNKPDVTGAVLSPDGGHVAITSNQNDSQNLVVLNTATDARTVLLDVKEFSKREASLRGITWLDNEHIAVEFTQISKGVDNLVDTKQASQMLVVQLPGPGASEVVVKSVRTRGKMVSALPEEPYFFLYSKRGVYSHIYKIDVRKLLPHKQRMSKLTLKDGGQFKAANQVVSVDGYVIDWFLSKDGSPKAALYTKDNNLIKLNDFKSDNTLYETALTSWDWNEIKELKEEKGDEAKLILPVAMSETAGVFYSFDFNEDQKRTVYRSNYNTGEHEPILESNAYKIISLIQARDNRLLGVRVLKDGTLQNIFLEMLTGQSQQTTQSQELEVVTGRSIDEQTAVIYRESHDKPGRYYVKKGNTERLIGSVYPALDKQLDARLVEDSIVVEDLSIPYLLSLPEKTSGQLPLVVMPHGGPIGVYDSRYFDASTQYLVANGYAVLRVNFRGSGGYSPELLEAGTKQFGGLILKDIHSATLKVLGRADINKDKVCIAGLSYGGYAATMLTIQYPEIYQCAVTVAGVSDVNLHLNSATITKGQIRWSKEHIGDSQKEYDELMAISPIAHIHKLSRPLLIMHGRKDTIVDIEHAYRLKLLLEKHNLPFEWQEFPEGEHQFKEPAEAKETYRLMLDFINNNI